MKLYYKTGACSLASHIALIELGEQFSLEQVDTEIGQTENGTDFSEINPNGYVPALETNNHEIITENTAILQYLSDLHPQSELTAKPGTMERVRQQELLSFLSSELHKAFGPFFRKPSLVGDAKKRALKHLSQRIDFIANKLSDDRSYLLSENFTAADAYGFVILNWAHFLNIDLNPWPKLISYMELIQKRPSVQQAMISEGLIESRDAT